MINDLATYDTTKLPKLVKPLTPTRKESTQYLGGKYIAGGITVSVSFSAFSREEMNLLYEFWEVDCKHGTKPFILTVDIFGINSENGNLLAFKWVGGISATNNTAGIYEGNATLLLKYKINSENELVEI